MFVQNGSRRYIVGDLAAETPEYRLYLCTLEGEGRQYLLQVATDIAQNGGLDRAAYILTTLLEHAGRLEEEYARVRDNPKKKLNYQLCFPDLIDGFVSPDQGDRRINILAFREVEDPRLMVPLHNIVHRDNRRVDIRTSVWILGKLLKTLVFVNDADFTINQVTPGNILIEPDKHYVVVFNLTAAEKHPEGVSSAAARDEIKRAAEVVLEVLGGTMEGGVPDDGSEQYSRYIEHVIALAQDGDRTAFAAHQAFYALVDQLWPRGFHPFATLPR